MGIWYSDHFGTLAGLVLVVFRDFVFAKIRIPFMHMNSYVKRDNAKCEIRYQNIIRFISRI